MVANKKIDYRFKFLYAIGIIMVCSAHTKGGGITLLSNWFPFGGLNLPLFVFSSGYFYKSSSEKQLGKYFFKKIRTLIVPLYLYNVAYGIIAQVLRQAGFNFGRPFNLYNLLIAPITMGNQFSYNLAGWFIIPLFMVEINNVLLRKIIHKFTQDIPEIFLFLLSIILGLIGNQLACSGYYYGWWLVLVRMMYFVPFYGLGIFYKNLLEKYDKKIPSFWYFACLFLIRLIIGYHYGKMLEYTPCWCNDFTEGPVMPIIVGFLGIALWMRIATIVEPVLGRSKWINLIADNTYSIMMNQFLGFMIVKTIYAFFNKMHIAFADFDWIEYKNTLYWYYIPKGFNKILILYLISGIAFSILVQKIIDTIKDKYIGKLQLNKVLSQAHN